MSIDWKRDLHMAIVKVVGAHLPRRTPTPESPMRVAKENVEAAMELLTRNAAQLAVAMCGNEEERELVMEMSRAAFEAIVAKGVAWQAAKESKGGGA